MNIKVYLVGSYPPSLVYKLSQSRFLSSLARFITNVDQFRFNL